MRFGKDLKPLIRYICAGRFDFEMVEPPSTWGARVEELRSLIRDWNSWHPAELLEAYWPITWGWEKDNQLLNRLLELGCYSYNPTLENLEQRLGDDLQEIRAAMPTTSLENEFFSREGHREFDLQPVRPETTLVRDCTLLVEAYRQTKTRWYPRDLDGYFPLWWDLEPYSQAIYRTHMGWTNVEVDLHSLTENPPLIRPLTQSYREHFCFRPRQIPDCATPIRPPLSSTSSVVIAPAWRTQQTPPVYTWTVPTGRDEV